MSFKPVFLMVNDPVWYDNAQRFATKQEAMDSASARYAVWTSPVAYDAHESPDPVNYVRLDGRDHPVVQGAVDPVGHSAQAVTL